MYVKVPPHLEESFFKEVRRHRLRTSLLYFPVLVLILPLIGALGFFTKGHVIVYALQKYLFTSLSDDTLLAVVLGSMAFLTTSALVLFFWSYNRDCKCEPCLYCAPCDAVDRFDDGLCPICRTPLAQRAYFFSTVSKGEEKIIRKFKLRACRVK